MGIVIVGPSGAGKSTLWRTLRAALGKTGKVVRRDSTSSLEFHLSLQLYIYYLI